MEQVNVSDFKAVCLSLLERVRQTGEPIEIIENGESVAMLYPPPSIAKRAAYGAMKDTLRGPVGDLITPLAPEEWEALRD